MPSMLNLSLWIFFIIWEVSKDNRLATVGNRSVCNSKYSTRPVEIPLYPAPLRCQSGATRGWAFDVRTMMCCTSLQVSEGLWKDQTGRETHSHTCRLGLCGVVCGRAAYLASNVRAMTPAATEAESELSNLARLQLCFGPSVTCWGPQSYLSSQYLTDLYVRHTVRG